MPTPKIARSTLILGALLLIAAGASVWWFYVRIPPLVGFASGNGRLEVQEIDVATKFQGRIAEVLVDEGDRVQVGQVVARMDMSSLNAQVREAEAQVLRARQGQVTAKALIAQRRSEALLAERDLERSRALYVNANISAKDYDRARSTMDTAKAAITQAEAQLAEADAAIAATLAQKERIQVDLKDSALTASRSGRVQFRLAEPGEVLASGGKVLTLIDPADVYMTIFCRRPKRGRLRWGRRRGSCSMRRRVSSSRLQSRLSPTRRSSRPKKWKPGRNARNSCSESRSRSIPSWSKGMRLRSNPVSRAWRTSDSIRLFSGPHLFKPNSCHE